MPAERREILTPDEPNAKSTSRFADPVRPDTALLVSCSIVCRSRLFNCSSTCRCIYVETMMCMDTAPGHRHTRRDDETWTRGDTACGAHSTAARYLMRRKRRGTRYPAVLCGRMQRARGGRPWRRGSQPKRRAAASARRPPVSSTTRTRPRAVDCLVRRARGVPHGKSLGYAARAQQQRPQAGDSTRGGGGRGGG